jgi:hypothetical protein
MVGIPTLPYRCCDRSGTRFAFDGVHGPALGSGASGGDRTVLGRSGLAARSDNSALLLSFLRRSVDALINTSNKIVSQIDLGASVPSFRSVPKVKIVLWNNNVSRDVSQRRSLIVPQWALGTTLL